MKKGGFYKQFTMNKTMSYPLKQFTASGITAKLFELIADMPENKKKESIKEFIERMWWLFIRHIFYMDKGANDMFSVISWKRF